jgi:hypothetical protein
MSEKKKSVHSFDSIRDRWMGWEWDGSVEMEMEIGHGQVFEWI